MSRWVHYNPNPKGLSREDCTVRAIAKALGITWEQAHILLDVKSIEMGDMAHGNAVWGAILRERGYKRYAIPNTCPDCYTAEDFATDHQEGTYVLGFGDHVATVKQGRIFDSFDSSQEVPQYYWTNEEE